ncbi:MAG: PspC domain-containing protein [Firmicutes bacterium]|nr:PspC domain-containing protein [Bacillota bacterium]
MKGEFFGLYRDERHRFLAGVCGGLATAWGLDLTLTRVAWVILGLASPWFALGLYLVAWFTLPFKASHTGLEMGPPLWEEGRLGRLIGGLLVGLGLYYLLEELTLGACGRFLGELRRYLWPIFFFTLGGLLLLPGKEDEASPGGAEGVSHLPEGHHGQA